MRDTYRYTPLLAWMLQPNILVNIAFGKLLFIILDIATGYLIYSITKASNVSEKHATICATLWLLNPLPMTVSSRGNAESIMSFLVLWSLKLLQDMSVCASGAVFALAVHFKIYPVVYALPIYMWLGDKNIDLKKACWKDKIKFILPNINRIYFIATAGLIMGGLTWLFYSWYEHC